MKNPSKLKNRNENQELYRMMIENSRDGVAITQNSRFKFVNRAFCEMVGYSADELLLMPGSNLLAPHEETRMMEQHKQRMLGAALPSFDNTTLLHKDGSMVDIEMSATPITFEGETASFITARNVTDRNKMQAAIEKSELKYRNLVENAHDGIIITQNGKFKFVNKAFCSIVEYSEDELIEHDFLQIVDPGEQDKLREYHRLRMSGNQHQMIYDAKGVSKSGKTIYFEINTSYIDYNGQPATFIILRDHTNHKLLEDTLMASEKKYRKLFEAESDAIFLIDKVSGAILDANPAATKIYGYSHEEFLQLRNTDMSAEPEKTAKATKMDQIYIPVRYHRKKDGTVFAVEITAGNTDLDNRVVHIITVREITERLKMQSAVEQSERKYRELLEFLPQTVYELDLQGNLTYVNRAGMKAFGLGPDYQGTPANMGFVPGDRELMAEGIRNFVWQKMPNVPREYTALRVDGSTFPVIIYGVPMIQNGEIFGIRGLIIDISERKAMEEEIRQAHKRLEEINQKLEATVRERTNELTLANTQLLQLQKENLQSQFDVLKQQVNPHFLFNSLNVLTSLIRLEPELAEKFTEHLSQVYRYVLENKDNELVKLSTELEFLDAYLFLLNIRFMGKIDVRINICNDCNHLKIIPLAVQLLIENAIKHNSMSKKSPLTITIFVDDQTRLNVINNLQERESYLASTGLGLQNIKHRYLLLNLPEPSFEKFGGEFIARVPLVHS